MIAVESSNLAGVDYDYEDTLVIAFHSGGVFAYDGVPYSEYAGLMQASSPGRYFHERIKKRYSCRKLSG